MVSKFCICVLPLNLCFVLIFVFFICACTCILYLYSIRSTSLVVKMLHTNYHNCDASTMCTYVYTVYTCVHVYTYIYWRCSTPITRRNDATPSQVSWWFPLHALYMLYAIYGIYAISIYVHILYAPLPHICEYIHMSMYIIHICKLK